MRRIIAALLLLLLAGLGLMLIPGGEEPVGPNAPAPDSEQPAPDPEPVAAPEVQEPAPRAAHPTEEEPPLPDFLAEEMKGPKVTVSGTAVVVEEDGAERTDLSGTLELNVWKDRTGYSREVPVAKGNWTAEVPAGTRVEFLKLMLAGREAVLHPEFREEIPVAPDARIDLKAAWFVATSLRVLADDTGNPLQNLTLVYGLKWPEHDLNHPGAGTVRGTRISCGGSPIALPRRGHHRAGWSVPYHVRAPGYAWGRIEADPMAGGERTIRLAPGGELIVRIVAAKLDRGARLRVRYPLESEPQFEILPGGRTEITVDGLPGGKVEVSLELGDWWGDTILLAKTPGTVVPGGSETVLLEAKELPTLDRVPFAGEVVVPPEWGLEQIMITIGLLDTPRGGQEENINLTGRKVVPVPDRKGVFRFDAGKLQPGRYEVGIFETGWTTSLRLGEQGATDLRIEVPPPAMVSVRVLDADTGGDAELPYIHWNAERPQWVRGGGLAAARRNPKTKCFEFRAPQGRVEIDCGTDDYFSEERTVEVGPGVTRVEISIRKSCGVRLRLQAGNSAIEWDWDWDLGITHLGGEGRFAGSTTGGGSHLVRLSEPGTYRLTFPKIAGYKPVPRQEVRVEARTITELTIQLERED